MNSYAYRLISATAILLFLWGCQPNADDNATGSDPLSTLEDFPIPPLTLADEREDINQVKLLLARGSDVNAHTEKVDPALIWAALSGHIEVVKLLLRNGAEVNIRGLANRTPLIDAATGCRDPDIIKLLIDHHAELNAQDNDGATPLIAAAIVECTEGVKLLLDAGSDPSPKTKEGLTALDYAKKRRHIEIVKLMELR